MTRETRRDFMNRAVGTGLAAAAGGSALSALSGCGGADSGKGGVIEDPAAVKGGPKTVMRKDVRYPEGYVGPMASDKGRIVVKGERVELKIVVPKNSTVGDYASNAFTKWYEKRTGVHVKWIPIGLDETTGEDPSPEQMTKVNAMIASGDIPDIFMNLAFSPSQVYVHGKQGLLRPLETYIDDYGVEIRRIFKAYPDTRKLMTAPDGHIYSMPYVNDCFHCKASQRMWINQKWLDRKNLAMPETIEDFEKVLEAFVKGDPNGNGQADEVPLMTDKDNPLDGFIMNAFVYTPGHTAQHPWVVVDNGKVDVAYRKDGWREGLRYMRRLFTKGLLDKASFSQDRETLQRVGDSRTPILGVAKGLYWGAFMTTIDDDDPKHRMWDYVAVPPLKGPTGTQYAAWDYYGWLQQSHFVVTRQCKNPAVAVMWADGQYELETQMNSYSGIKGKHWRYAKPGEKGFEDEQGLWTTIGSWGGPQMDGKWWDQNGVNYRSLDYRNGEVVDQESPTFEKPLYDETKNKYYPRRQPKEMQLPPLYMNEEQAALVAQLEVTFTSKVKAAMANFTTGRLDIDDDAQWKRYLDSLEKTGLDRYLKAYQQAYDALNGKK